MTKVNNLSTHKTVLTIPNFLSFLRLVGIPYLVYLLSSHRIVASALFLIVLVITDFLDGFIARRFNQGSRIGEILDPTVDRVFIFVVPLALAIGHYIHVIQVISLLLRELLLLLTYPFLYISGFKKGVPVLVLGKVATSFVFFWLVLSVLGNQGEGIYSYFRAASNAAYFWGIVLYYVSLAYYWHFALVRWRNSAVQ